VSLNNQCNSGDGKPDAPPSANASTLSNRALFLPATFVPVNFFPINPFTSSPARSYARDTCCPGTSCSRRRPTFYTCLCGTAAYAEATACSDTNGMCADYDEVVMTTCMDEQGRNGFCPEFFIVPCSSNPTPTPTPSETPTPTATPTPTPEPVCTDPRPNDSCPRGSGAGRARVLLREVTLT
jgi:hypothetical protein